jgi:hypothetical protein
LCKAILAELIKLPEHTSCKFSGNVGESSTFAEARSPTRGKHPVFRPGSHYQLLLPRTNMASVHRTLNITSGSPRSYMKLLALTSALYALGHMLRCRLSHRHIRPHVAGAGTVKICCKIIKLLSLYSFHLNSVCPALRLSDQSPGFTLFSNNNKRRMASSGMLRRVALVGIDAPDELSASFIRVKRIGELGTTLALTSNRRTLRRNTLPSSPILVTLTKEALRISETSVLTRTTRRNIPEDTIFHSRRCENLKSYIVIIDYISETLGYEAFIAPLIQLTDSRSCLLHSCTLFSIHTCYTSKPDEQESRLHH